MTKYHKILSVFKRDSENKFTSEFSCDDFKYLKDNKWIWTEKIDGTNIRIYWDGKSVRFAGRTDNASIPAYLYDKLNKIFFNEKMMKKLPEVFEQKEDEEIDVVLYGEGYGAKIQKGGGNYISDGVDFVLFDIKINNIWLKREDVEMIAKSLSLDIVPIVGSGTIKEAIKFVSNGFNSKWGKFLAEGIVMRPEIELNNRRGYRIITKLKHKDFI